MIEDKKLLESLADELRKVSANSSVLATYDAEHKRRQWINEQIGIEDVELASDSLTTACIIYNQEYYRILQDQMIQSEESNGTFIRHRESMRFAILAYIKAEAETQLKKQQSVQTSFVEQEKSDSQSEEDLFKAVREAQAYFDQQKSQGFSTESEPTSRKKSRKKSKS